MELDESAQVARLAELLGDRGMCVRRADAGGVARRARRGQCSRDEERRDEKRRADARRR